MTTYDIRLADESEIDVIIVADYNGNGEYVRSVQIDHAGRICVAAEEYEDYYVNLRGKGDAENLILALRKAIDIGWFEK